MKKEYNKVNRDTIIEINKTREMFKDIIENKE